MLNIRTAALTWACRLGCQLWQVLPGSGSVRLLDNLYMSDGSRTRLAAQGNGSAAQLYELKEGTDTGFVTASGGSGLGGSSFLRFQGVTLGNKFYLSDRNGSLLRYTPTPANGGNHVQAVTQPAAPTAAPGASRRTWAILWDWSTGGNDSDAVHFDDVDATSSQPAPISGKTRQLRVFDSGALGNTVSINGLLSLPFVGDLGLQSHTVAYWVRQDRTGNVLSFQIFDATQGVVLGSSALYADTAAANTWYPFFLDIGDLQLGSFRWLCTGVPASGGANLWVSDLILPGNLEGPYRWVYTHYDSVMSRESPPSAVSNGGQVMDFSSVGVSYNLATGNSFTKSCALTFTSDSGSDSSTDRIRVYRSGGVPELTVDDTGNDLWLRVADVPDYSSTFSQTDTAGSSLLHFATVPSTLQKGMWLVLDKGVTGKQEWVQISGVSAGTPGTVNITRGLGTAGTTLYSHSSGTGTVQIALVDNTANEQIDLVDTLDVERNNPPAGARFVARSPEGRLWLFNYSGHPTGIAVSNHPTPDRPNDYEVFPDGVDPLTRRSVTQGFRTQYTGDISEDEEITWGGFYRGHPMFFTRLALYVVRHQSQVDWSPTSIQRVHKHGCIAGDTVVEQNGVLYWVADGPRVMAWDGSSEPQCISDRRVNVRLNAASVSSWQSWFAVGHTTVDGAYYKLFFTPAGASGNTQRLDYNIQRDAWEPCSYNDSNGAAIAYQAAAVRGGNVDSPDLYQADGTGKIDQMEVGSLDRNQPIAISLLTQKIGIRRLHPYWTGWLESGYPYDVEFFLPSGVTDTVTAQISTGGAEYGVNAFSYSVSLAGSGDTSLKLRADRSLKGRWMQLQVSGSVSNRPAFRDILIRYILDRLTRITT